MSRTISEYDLMAVLKPGSRWRDNDPRYEETSGRPRIVEVVSVGITRAVIRNEAGLTTETKVSRFGRSGRAGFTLVPSHEESSNG